MDRSALLAAGAAILSIANPAVVRAQAAYSFDLPAQPLARSLRAVAATSGINIIFSEAEVRGEAAPPLRGSMGAAAALRHLLQRTRLSLSSTPGGSFIVSDPRKTPIALPASAQPTRTPPAAAGGPLAQRPTGSIEGHLADVGERGSFAGALVKILDTGAVTQTDELGMFRFADVPAGPHVLEISFLGFQTLAPRITVIAGAQARLSFAMGAPVSAGKDIVVYGSRSARATALNLERTGENSADIISADDLGEFTGTTISEALRRLPGVSFQRDGLTGDGTNVIIRGLDPDMNSVKLNGLHLPVGNGTGRSPDLSNLLADSVSKITVNKTLLPSQDSEGTGGLVEIETLSPLARPHRYANALIEGGRSGKGFSDDFLASATVSGSFGAERNFGVSASVQYRRNSARSVSYNAILEPGAFLPPGPDGAAVTNVDQLDPRTNFPFISGVTDAYPTSVETDFNRVTKSTLATTLSAEWKIGSHTDLRFDYQHDETKQTTVSLGDVFATSLVYAPLPGSGDNTALYLDTSPGNASLSHTQQYGYDPDSRKATDTYSLNGTTTLGKFVLTYLGGYAHGTERHPRNFGEELRTTDNEALPEYFQPQATDPTLDYIISPFPARHGRSIPQPLLTSAGRAALNGTDFTIDDASGQIDRDRGLNNRYTGEFSARFNAGWGPLSYLEIGAHYENVRFESRLDRTQLGGGTPISALGLSLEPSDLSRIGLDGAGFDVINNASLEHFVDTIDSYVGTDGFTLTPVVLPAGTDKQYTLEENLAGYAQSRLTFGKLEVIGGVRVNRTRLEANNLIYPVYIGPIIDADGGGFGIDQAFQAQFSKLVNQHATATDVLPRILFNFRQSDNLIVRGGFYLSVARPEIAQLSSDTRISFINIPIPGPEGVKPILTINTGNPNLKPSSTQNFDLSVEHYDQHIGVIKLSGFYKRIRNLLQANATNGPAQLATVVLPDSIYFQGAPYFDPAHPENYFITGSTPANSDRLATIWGIETQVERRFTFLPGVLSGLGVFANYTYTKSSRAQIYNWAAGPNGTENVEFRSIPFDQQPKSSGTAALTYNKYDIDATLTYGFQSRMLAQFLPRDLSYYQEAVHTLDFRVSYYLRPSFAKIRLYFEGTDLLKNTGTPDLEQTVGGEGSAPKYYARATYLGGRRFKIGMSATF